ncbi:uncharacterized protein TM35_000371410 [Trypanosoma theileri]|uniref:Uncharacterized protein n=1 Tax=Trypanosoma theileri TaxID=67003 RepID=A0A1X0NKX4_9TRYP|nr:uncharacterized protein TM35_000371410 [Trypanosoma theileri]ORC85168.1 hypothetical protein TM35_000371410 [Trypanosoma theileri]
MAGLHSHRGDISTAGPNETADIYTTQGNSNSKNIQERSTQSSRIRCHSRSRRTTGPRNHKRNGGRRKVNVIDHKRYGKYSSALRNDSSLNKERSFGPRRGGSGRTRSRSTIINTVRETCRPHGTPTQHSALSGPLGRHIKQVRTLDIIDVRELEEWELPESATRHFGAPFKGHDILQRSHHTRVATKDDEARLPLQQIDLGTLSTKWIRGRLNGSARRRWDEAWNIMRKPELHTRRRESQLRINNTDAQRMNKPRIICTTSSHPTTGWVGSIVYGSGGKTLRAEKVFHRLAKGKECQG